MYWKVRDLVYAFVEEWWHTFAWGNEDFSRISGTLVHESGCSWNWVRICWAICCCKSKSDDEHNGNRAKEESWSLPWHRRQCRTPLQLRPWARHRIPLRNRVVPKERLNNERYGMQGCITSIFALLEGFALGEYGYRWENEGAMRGSPLETGQRAIVQLQVLARQLCHGIMTMGKPERSLNLFTSLMPHSFAISDFATDSITAGALVILTFVCLS